MAEQVHAMADQLRQYATHFEMRDWCYTRQHDIERIKHRTPWSDYDHWHRRVKRAAWELARRRNDALDQILKVSRFGMALTYLRADKRTPDGWLDNGGVITIWEETGEYLQYVQPSVGALLADLMDAHPDLPEVQAIAAEMKRINDDYGQRLATHPAEQSERGES